MADGARAADSARLKVLISAYACGPGDEPEGAAGWAFASAAAQRHDVWVVTRKRFEPAIAAALAKDPELARHLTVIHADLPGALQRLKRSPGGLYWYYALWQRQLRDRARRMHASIGFDVMHHVTFANDWLPCGLATVDGPPFVWGPVGGSSRPSWRVARWMGLRGAVAEAVRAAAVWPVRRRFGDAASRRASLVVAQNADVAHRFRSARRVVVEANAVMDHVVLKSAEHADGEGEHASRAEPGTTETGGESLPRRAVMVGRLIGLKGCRLALAAMASGPVDHWRLDIYGDGYDRKSLERRASSLGLGPRVRFHGHRPRSEVLEAIGNADALLFPSFRDQAGWVAAEASSLGVPVVCLPLGGPPLLAGSNAHIASLRGDVATNLAATLAACIDNPSSPDHRWSADRLPDLLDDWYTYAVRQRSL